MLTQGIPPLTDLKQSLLKRAYHTPSRMAVEWRKPVGWATAAGARFCPADTVPQRVLPTLQCEARHRVTTTKSVPSPVSSPNPWSDTMSEEPGTINSEM